MSSLSAHLAASHVFGGVMDKIKGKVWANEYVDFGLLLSVTPGL